MKRLKTRRWLSIALRAAVVVISSISIQSYADDVLSPLSAFPSAGFSAPAPLLKKGKSVDWWFAFKLNSKVFPGCGGGAGEARACPFGGEVQSYTFGQQFVYGSSDSPTLQKGGGCVGATTDDPVGATFDQVYNGDLYYVVWNDQFYDDPSIAGCGTSCSSPWGHSKGMLAWNDAGDGFVLQVTTPSWPASGSRLFPRKTDGNTLGCVKDDDVKVSQHFFALKLNKDDVVAVLQALQNASVVTDPSNPQVVKAGGPANIQTLVAGLGTKSHSTAVMRVRLSSGVGLISKPSALHVPPWQMVSSLLGGVPLRTATWWASPKINSTVEGTPVGCWDPRLGSVGPVEIAMTGQWNGNVFGLKGGPGPDFNHAKIGVSTAGSFHFSVFGDMNQQGSLSGPNCGSSQNGRGGLFYVLENKALADGIASLISGDSAPAD
jgi:hypothetical protein